jgi:tRNA-2-methylthio-N6-dimethylallyladenosine synthase
VRFYIHTYGCQMNERDSDAIAALLVRHGYVRVHGDSEADVVLVNTCSVRGKAEDKALGKLRLMVAARRSESGPMKLVGAVGCMVQRLQDDLLSRVPGLDFGVGTHAIHRLPDVIARVLNGEGPVLDAPEASGDHPVVADHAEPGLSAFVTILLGCDRHCAYCIVPRVRGPAWSRPPSDIVDEVRRLAELGTREVTLLGQSVMSYGNGQPVWAPDYRSAMGFVEPLPRLLEAVSEVPGIRRVRFTSGHPSGCTPELARAMRDLGPVCEHLHMPLQSGSDRILGLMGRGYSVDEYRRSVACLREAIPDTGLTTDVIVGFPTETAADFEATRRFMDEMGFDNAFIFKYSPREGTPAAGWDDDVSGEEKARRNQVLLDDQERRGMARNTAWIGREVEVLVEGVSRRKADRWSGRTRDNKIAVFEPDPSVRVGEQVLIRIERAMPQTLHGCVVRCQVGNTGGAE